jgi:hypothetical protein
VLTAGRDAECGGYGVANDGQRPPTGSTHWLVVPGPRLQQNWPPEHGVQLEPHGPSQPELLAGPHPFTHWPLQQWKPGALLTAQSRQLIPHRVESVFGSSEQSTGLPKHSCLPAGHVQNPVDELQTLSPGQGSGEQVLPPVHIEFTQVWLVPHGLLQPPQCWVLDVVSVSQIPSPLQSAVPVAQEATHCPGATHVWFESQYSVPIAHGRHFFFFRLQRPEQHSLCCRQGLAPGGRQAAAPTSLALTPPLSGCAAASR